MTPTQATVCRALSTWRSLTAFALVVAAIGVSATGCERETSRSDAPAANAVATPPPEMSKGQLRHAELRSAYVDAVQRNASKAYALHPRDGGFSGGNRTQQFALRLEGGAAGLIPIGPSAESWTLALSLAGYDRADGSTPVAAVEPTQLAANRVTFHSEHGIEEWFVNGPLGLEQGFTLSAPPGGDESAAIAIRVAFGGSLTPVLRDDQRGVELRDHRGRARLRYTDLAAHDANGRRLPSWMAVDGADVVVRVDDTDARYPVMVDPLIWFEHSKLFASDGAVASAFGNAVAIDGDTIVVGAWTHDTTVNATPYDEVGAAYVFVRSDSVWAEEAKLIADVATPIAENRFGTAVDVCGDTAIVGAPHREGGDERGAAYVFVRSAGVWTEQQKLTVDAVDADRFGEAVACDGDVAVVGARGEYNGSGTQTGAAFVFKRIGASWGAPQKLEPTTGADGDAFGAAVDIDMAGNDADARIVVGAPTADILKAPGVIDAGMAHVYTLNVDTWERLITHTAQSFVVEGMEFGSDVAIESVNGFATIVVGAAGDDREGNNAGAAFQRRADEPVPSNISGWRGNVWPTNAGADDHTGEAVAIAGSQRLVGAANHKLPLEGRGRVIGWSGGVYGSNPTHYEYVATDTSPSSRYGASLDLDLLPGESDRFTAVVGAPGDNSLGNAAGAVYVVNIADSLGSYCTEDSNCASGFCVENVCCDLACDGAAETCYAIDGVEAIATMGGMLPCDDPLEDQCTRGVCKDLPSAACTSSSECLHGSCVDGVCCDLGCDGPCEACSSAKTGVSDGECAPVAIATDPDGECDAGNACDGSGSCKSQASQACGANTECISGNCVDGVCCDTVCDGPCDACDMEGNLGTCTMRPVGTVAPECGGAACTGESAACPDACTAPENCDAGFTCIDGSCTPLVDNGGACAIDPICESGHCVNEVCCTEANCGEYRCGEAGLCLDACSTSADCTLGNVCGAARRCGPPPSAVVDATCSLPRPGRRSSNGFTWLVTLTAVGAWLSRRTRGDNNTHP